MFRENLLMRLSLRWKWSLASSALLFTMLLTKVPSPSFAADSLPYHSPYGVKFSIPVAKLTGDLQNSERGSPQLESTLAYPNWYRNREHLGSWGPPARHYPPPHDLANQGLTWKRERVIATALRFQGYGYQHHHIPDWAPPADWAWKETAVGHNGKGVDCSNFSAFVYNQALGIKPNGDVHKQSEQRTFAGPGEGRFTRVERIELSKNYQDLVKTLKTGDLLYVKGNPHGKVTHVVLWVGSIGQGPDGIPLVIDSHGQGVKDSNGVQIPAGIHLRPFREDSWYFKSASHASRVLHD
jgi:cell wall-associated NlpC family hydrolase